MDDEVDLFAALRPELDGAMLQLAWTRRNTVAASVAACLPWPWAVCGVGEGLEEVAFARVLSLPVLWFWLGVAPGWVPSHRRAHRGWRDLVADIRGCLGRSIGGVSLAPNRGLHGPWKQLILSPGLEGLVASSPDPVAMPTRVEALLKQAMRKHDLPLTLVREPTGVRVERAS